MRKELDLLQSLRSEGLVLHAQGKIIDCDQSFARILGYSLEELKGMRLSELKIALLEDQGLQALHHPSQLRASKKDGTSIYLEVLENPSSPDDNHLGAMIIRDITERVHNEKINGFEKQIESAPCFKNNRVVFTRLLNGN
ncbi:PAS domain S-box protein [Halobacillus salinarum]|uniref:PAS domain S-box protein n=1 Tax=Halobacillus salinarum TaxID=2932257 RepID=A0ABY4EGH7_9BACI|nr:PAS domain S-box protein [Halobacillus salinarum]UOQ43246.1 PAS domain S-box protein [Halobacillus salinarum]